MNQQGERVKTPRLSDYLTCTASSIEKNPPVDLLPLLSASPLYNTTCTTGHDRTRHDTCAQIYFYQMSDYCFIYDLYIPTYLANPSYAWDYMNTKSPPSIPELICRLFFCRLVVFGSPSPSLSLSLQQREGDRWSDYKTCVKYIHM